MLRECPLTDDSVGFDGSPANGLNRCFSPVAPRPGQGLLSDHVAGAQSWRRERVFMPTPVIAPSWLKPSRRKRTAIHSEGGCYSMISSARARRDCGTVRPSASAVLRLITSRNLVGCWTGNSPAFAPLRMRST